MEGGVPVRVGTKVHHVNKPGFYNCDYMGCLQEFSNAQGLFNHQLMTQHINDYCCLCDKTFSARSKLRRHIDSVHAGKNHGCWFCDKFYNREDHLMEHILRSHGLAACKDCKATFPEKEMLKNHRAQAHVKI